MYWTAEDEPEEVDRRLSDIGIKRADVGDRLRVVDGAGRGPLWAADGGRTESLGKLYGLGHANVVTVTRNALHRFIRV